MSKNNNLRSKQPDCAGVNSRDGGFSLIEVAIALLVIGLIVAPILAAYNATIVGDRLTESRGKLAKIENAINQYFASGFGAYPCPASLLAREGDADFGEQGLPATNVCNVLTDLTLCSDSDWRDPGGEGFCTTSMNPADAVLIGAVPFDPLRLSQKDTIDAWGNKILYAVTQQQTEAVSFGAHPGAIITMAIDDANINNKENLTPNLNSPADFFLVSLGETGIGAYSKDGVLIANCATDADSDDFENCNMDRIFFNDINTLLRDNTGARSLQPGTRFYDDITRFQMSVPEGLWFAHANYPSHIVTMSEFVGIGTANPLNALEVVGNIRVGGNVKSDEICDDTANDCFDPELIVGTRPEMDCTDRGVMSMNNRRLNCTSVSMESGGGGFVAVDGDEAMRVITGNGANKYTLVNCAASGQVISGFTPSGDAICSPPIPAP